MSNNSKAIPLFKVYMAPESELMPRIRKVLYSGEISEGEPVYQFEREFGAFAGCTNVLSFYSGTAALHTALVLAGVLPGDEVISTPMTAEPTNMAIAHAGGKIVWADVDPSNGNISAESVRDMITERTKAIMVVHYGGIPACLSKIQELCRQHGVPVIEDCAHALGASYNGSAIGTTSEYGMYSLQAIKHMTTIDGGMLAVRDPQLLARGRKFRWFGIDRQTSRTEVDVDMIGYKYHMNNVNATIGSVQLRHIEPLIAHHIENGKYFDKHLRGVAGIEQCRWDHGAQPSYWFYTILAEKRDSLIRYLRERNIGCSLCHKRNDQHSIFKNSSRHLPGLDYFYSRMLHIPCGWWLTDEDREYIVSSIARGW